MTKKENRKIVHKIMIVLVCIAVNLLGKFTAVRFRFPIWLDMTGTCLAVYFAGTVSGVAAGVLSNLIFGVADGVSMAYAITSLVMAVSVGYCVKKGYFDELSKAAVSSFWIGILCVCVSTPINLILYAGYSGNMWGDALFDMLDWQGVPVVFCAIADEAIVEIVDKQIGVLIAFALIRLILHVKKKRTGGQGGLKKALCALLLAGVLLQAFTPGLIVYAKTGTDASDNFAAKIYNNSTGMMSSEANVIEETEDGYIWIGSYAGLTRYDGKEFEFIREGGIAGVNCMLTDSRGRLWIGTNDSGIARYEDGKFTFFTMQDGLPANSIRAFAEGENGVMYVGTTDRMCAVDGSDEILVLEQNITYVISMECIGDVLVAVNNNGELFALGADYALLDKEDGLDGLFCNCVGRTSEGLMLGTSESEIYLLDTDGTKIRIAGKRSVPIMDIIAMDEDREGKVWMCAEAGIGYLDTDGTFEEKRFAGFDSSFEWIHVDYQGNIWVASSRHGVLKLSESRFVDLFALADVPGTVVNAVVSYRGDCYCGTDSGLVILDGRTGESRENELTELLKGVRVRCLMTDSKGRLWICTYSDLALICCDGAGDVEIYDMDGKQMTSNRVRCALEMDDGTIVAGTADGINFIRDGRVVGTITAEDGLSNTQILSMAKGEDGVLYAGSDGGGLYEIKEQRIVRNDTTQDGLSSDVILRIVPCGKGYLLVTSNALCYKEKDIQVLKNFPYFNNYDVVLDGNTAYVLSSAGIYVVDASRLCAQQELTYQLYNANNGLQSGLVANSWNYLGEDGSLYFCTNGGVVRLCEEQENTELDCHYGVTSVMCDAAAVACEDGVYRLPQSAKRVVISASVRNYALADIKVRFFIEGLEDDPQICSYQELAPIQLTNLPTGDYRIRFQIVDDADGTIVQEKTYMLVKEKQIWEYAWYKVYLILVCAEIIAFATWTILIMVNNARRKEELERMRKELEEKVKEQTVEIRRQQVQTVTALSDAVDAKDYYTSGHSKRVAVYARMLAARMGKGEAEQEEIYRAGLLHDVGKIRIPEEVINKPGKLTPEEYELIKIHPVTGYHILKGISGGRAIAQGARFHHERYDGGGYPNGLQGENIPEVARIIGVADAYDAMASNRSYRKALSQKLVRAEIEKGKGTQFDPKIADIMLDMIDEDKEYAMRQTDEMQRTILVVDDEPEDIEAVKEILRGDPMYKILCADSCAGAVKLLEEDDQVHLILLDAKMRDEDALGTLARIREIVSVPVVFTLSDMDIGMIQRAMELGVDDYLTKPFLPLVLREVVHSILNGGKTNK